MSSSDKNITNAETLIQKYLDQIASDEEVAVLSELIESDKQVTETYVRLAHLHATLAADESLREEITDRNLKNPPIQSKRTELPAESPTRRTWLKVSAVGVGLTMTLAFFFDWSPPPTQTTGPFARVASATGVQGLNEQSLLLGDWQQLSEGTLELITGRQARLVIEAPARFRLESAERLQLGFGRLAADVPPSARGFTVVTPTGEVVDLGTKFGVDVANSGTAEVHVFQGEVIAQPSGGQKQQSLVDGDALLLTGKNEQRLALRTSAFIQPNEIEALHAGLSFGQQQRAEAALDKFSRDPELIALFDFEDQKKHSGKYRMLQGRWPGSRAPEFSKSNDHIRIEVGNERAWPQITLAAWVRLDHVGAPFQSILHTDGWSNDNPGQVHWMVRRKTVMRLGIFGNSFPPDVGDHPRSPDSQSPVLPEHQGWFHLATVYDSSRKIVRFYLNGQFDNEVLLEAALPATFGLAQIGNWDGADRKLNGRIDELLILGRALTDDEIRSLHKSGNPYR